MTLPSKSFTTFADTSVDPDSPLDTVLMTGFRDNDIFLLEWVGKDYVGGVAINHNHDGVNSAAIETGLIAKNGSWEDGVGSAWTYADFVGGSHAINTSNHMHGANALAITSTVLANGGGTATKNEFWVVGGNKSYVLEVYIDASIANVSSRVQIGWYDNTQTIISTQDLYDEADTPTTGRRFVLYGQAPTTARYAKLVLTGGVPATGTATGTIYFDGVTFGEWQTGWETLEVKVLNADTTSDHFWDPSLFKMIRIRAIDVDLSTSATILGRYSSDGSTFAAGAVYNINATGGYNAIGIYTALTYGASSDSSFELSANSSISLTNARIMAEIIIINPNATGDPSIEFKLSANGFAASTDNVGRVAGSGFYNVATGTCQGFQLRPSSGNFTSGTIIVEGYK